MHKPKELPKSVAAIRSAAYCAQKNEGGNFRSDQIPISRNQVLQIFCIGESDYETLFIAKFFAEVVARFNHREDPKTFEKLYEVLKKYPGFIWQVRQLIANSLILEEDRIDPVQEIEVESRFYER